MANCHSVGIDQACLQIVNNDLTNAYEIRAQSEECYECPPWRYFTLHPLRNNSIIVNSTSATDVFIYDIFLNIKYRYSYHFDQHGIYSLSFNSSTFSPVIPIKHGNNEYNAIFCAAAVYIFLYWIWMCILGLHSRMIIERRYPREPIDGNNSDVNHSLVPSFRNSTQESRAIINLVATSYRLRSLDTFRGISIVLMIFVNYGGGKFYFFQHARWNGLTVADLVFPWFLWIMGVSLTFSIKSQLRRLTPYYRILLNIARRSLILFALGILINSLKSNHIPTLRIPGVLQRFAFCYAINALLETFRMKAQDSVEYFRFWDLRDLIWSWIQWAVILALVFLNLILTFCLTVPGCPKGYLGPGGLHANGSYPNCTGGATGYIDQLIFGKQHIHNNPTCKTTYYNPGPFDPEGILGTLMSCLTVQLGVASGRIIIAHSSHIKRIKRWLIWATFLGLFAGFLCEWNKEEGFIPVNKNLWSLSFVCVTASFALILFSLLYFIMDANDYWDGSIFRVAGMNSILLYVGHEITGKLVPFSWSPVGKNHTEHMFMALWGTSLWIAIAFVCHKRKLYFSV